MFQKSRIQKNKAPETPKKCWWVWGKTRGFAYLFSAGDDVGHDCVDERERVNEPFHSVLPSRDLGLNVHQSLDNDVMRMDG